MSTPTPRSDDAARKGAYLTAGQYPETCGKQIVHIDFARQLEREIAELNQRLIDRQESFQAQLVRIENTWREKLCKAMKDHGLKVEWQPIETAILNGEQNIIIARLDDKGEIQDIDFDAVYESDYESWEIPQPYMVWKSAYGRVEEPTHWMPTPILAEALRTPDAAH